MGPRSGSDTQRKRSARQLEIALSPVVSWTQGPVLSSRRPYRRSFFSSSVLRYVRTAGSVQRPCRSQTNDKSGYEVGAMEVTLQASPRSIGR